MSNCITSEACNAVQSSGENHRFSKSKRAKLYLPTTSLQSLLNGARTNQINTYACINKTSHPKRELRSNTRSIMTHFTLRLIASHQARTLIMFGSRRSALYVVPIAIASPVTQCAVLDEKNSPPASKCWTISSGVMCCKGALSCLYLRK